MNQILQQLNINQKVLQNLKNLKVIKNGNDELEIKRYIKTKKKSVNNIVYCGFAAKIFTLLV